MTDWIKHDGGPQPVADDVWVDRLDGGFGLAGFLKWNWSKSTSYRILNQHLIDAKQAEIDALKEDLAIWDSVFPDLLPDRLKSDKQLAEEDVAAKIDAARLEGIRLGLEAAAGEIVERQELASNCPDGGSEYLRTDHMLADLCALDPETIAREAADKETAR